MYKGEKLGSIELNVAGIHNVLNALAAVAAARYCGVDFSAIQKVPAQTAAILSYIDPVVAVLVSALVLKESISALTMLGTVMVIAAAVASEISPHRTGESS